jgi:hypothetical protein
MPPASPAASTSAKARTNIELYDRIYTGLLTIKFSEDRARKYASFCTDVYDYVQQDADLQIAIKGAQFKKFVDDAGEAKEGLQKAYEAGKQLANAKRLNLPKSMAAAGKLRGASASKGLAAFVDVFEAVAKYEGIPLNECAMAVAKVALDFAGVLAGTTGAGLLLSALAVLSVGKDSYDLGVACFN